MNFELGLRQFWLLWALVLTGIAVWIFATPTEPAPALVGQRRGTAPIDVPRPPPLRDSRAELEQLATATLWGPLAAKAPAVAASAPPEPKWLLSGVFTSGSTTRVILHYERNARPAQLLRVGDKLPDGAVLDLIENDRVRVQLTPAQRRERGLKSRELWLPVNRGLRVPDNGR